MGLISSCVSWVDNLGAAGGLNKNKRENTVNVWSYIMYSRTKRSCHVCSPGKRNPLGLTSVLTEHSEQWSVMPVTSVSCLSTSCYCPACLNGVWSPLHLPSRWTANMASDLSGHWLTVRKQHSTKCVCVCVWWVAVVGRTLLIYSWKCIHKKW